MRGLIALVLLFIMVFIMIVVVIFPCCSCLALKVGYFLMALM
jgi:hypothetical protein